MPNYSTKTALALFSYAKIIKMEGKHEHIGLSSIQIKALSMQTYP